MLLEGKGADSVSKVSKRHFAQGALHTNRHQDSCAQMLGRGGNKAESPQRKVSTSWQARTQLCSEARALVLEMSTGQMVLAEYGGQSWVAK